MSDSEWLLSNMERTRRTQREIADLLGIDPSGVSRLLSGKRGLPENERRLLEEYFASVGNGEEAADSTRRLGVIYRIGNIEQAELAALSGVSRERLQAIESMGASFEPAEANAIGRAIGIRPDWLLGHMRIQDGQARIVEFRRRRQSIPSISRLPSGTQAGIPIYAPARLIEGRLVCKFVVAERRPVPHALLNVEGAFGLFVGDGDYGSRFRRGDVLYVHPSKPIQIGRDALAILGDESIVVGLIVSISDAGVELRVGDDVRSIGTSDRIHLIVGAWWD